MFKSRKEAGELLAEEFKDKILGYNNVDIIALPRGGVPVAYEVSKKLKLPLDIFCIKKIGAPYNKELALGAVTETGEYFLNPDMVSHFAIDDLKARRLIKAKREEAQEQARELRGGQKATEVYGKNIFIVDDGIATGATMKAAIKLIKKQEPQNIIILTPVSSRESLSELTNMVDDIFVLESPNNFYSVGGYYLEFPEVTNNEVRKILKEAESLRKENELKKNLERFENEGGAIK